MPLEDVSLQVEGRWEGERVKEWMRGGEGCGVEAPASAPQREPRREIRCMAKEFAEKQAAGLLRERSGERIRRERSSYAARQAAANIIEDTISSKRQFVPWPDQRTL